MAPVTLFCNPLTMADPYGTGSSSYARNASSSPALPLESEDMSSCLHNLLHNNPSSSSCMSSKSMNLTATGQVQQGLLSSVPETANLPAIGLFNRYEKTFPDDRSLFEGLEVRFESDCRIRDGKLGVVDSSTGFTFSDPDGYFAADVRDARENTKTPETMSEIRRNFHAENDSDSDGYDSEKGLEPADWLRNPVAPGSSSKRSRNAGIHNLTEKRRRSKINEKIKDLQELIPNSNKTDKASLLDEAIEYLKQLHSQVQTLSTRSGLSMHPLYLPGAVQPMQMMQTGTSFNEGNGLLNTIAGSGPLTANQEPSNQAAFDLSSHFTSSNQPFPAPIFGVEPVNGAPYRPSFNLSSHFTFSNQPIPAPHFGFEAVNGAPYRPSFDLSSHCISSNQPIPAPNFGFEAVNDAPYRPSFNLSTTSKAFNRGDTLPELQLDVSHPGKNKSSRRFKRC